MGSGEFISIAVGIVFAVVGYLLAQKDARQAEHIKDLYEKHSTDAQKLFDLELQVAKNHPDRDAIKDMFTNFMTQMNERFDRLEQAVGVERRNAK